MNIVTDEFEIKIKQQYQKRDCLVMHPKFVFNSQKFNLIDFALKEFGSLSNKIVVTEAQLYSVDPR